MTTPSKTNNRVSEKYAVKWEDNMSSIKSPAICPFKTKEIPEKIDNP